MTASQPETDPLSTRTPPLHAIAAFMAAARRLSFKEAAAELNITPSALSRRIKRLEGFLGIELFERLNRGLKLTPKGRTYLAAIEKPVAEIARATDRFLSKERGRTLTLGVPQFLAANWLVPRLPALNAAHPWLNLELATVVGTPALGTNGMDVAIHYGVAEELVAGDPVKLFDLKVFPVCSARIATGLETASDLKTHTLLHAARLPDLWEQWLEAVGQDDLTPVGAQTFDNARLCFDGAENDLGVAIGVDVLADRFLREGRLLAPFDCAVQIKQAYFLVTPPELRSDERVRTLKAWLATEAAATSLSAPGR
jgi:LysR family transcriptional regulator, glycine cleavage system transcriptional activator